MSHHSPTAELKRNKLGSSDLHVTEVCLGTMTWGMQNSREDASEQLDYAVKECGVNFIDTAEMYPVPDGHPDQTPGLSESYIGDWLTRNKGIRDKVIIATKVLGRQSNSKIASFRYPQNSVERKNYPDNALDRKNIHDACHASLRKLQTDYIDLYQFHWPDRYVPVFGPRAYDVSKERESVPIIESLQAIKELMDQGKIRAYGLSNDTAYGVAECIRAADALGMPRPASIQNQFCLLNRRFEGELAEACAPSHYNVALLPYSILGGGALSGKYIGKIGDDGTVRDPSLARTRMALFERFMLRYRTKPVQEAIEKYNGIAEEAGISLATLAQAFCKTRFYITSSIIGATSMGQLRENIKAFEHELSSDVLQKIDAIHQKNKDIATS